MLFLVALSAMQQQAADQSSKRWAIAVQLRFLRGTNSAWKESVVAAVHTQGSERWATLIRRHVWGQACLYQLCIRIA